MQVLLCDCQIPPFRLRWLQIVWSIGERVSHQWIAGEEVFHQIWDGNSLLASLYLLYIYISRSFLCISTRNHLIFTGFQLAFMSFPSHITLAHITQSWSNVCCVQVMSLAVRFLVAIQGAVLYVVIHIAPSTQSLFSSTRGSYTLSVCFVGWLCRMWKHVRRTSNDQSRQVKYT